MEEDEDLAVLMAGLRGSNMNESDFAAEGQAMELLSVREHRVSCRQKEPRRS